MKVLITGAGGFLGHGIVAMFAGRHELRLMDIHDWDAPREHEKVVGSVADLAACRRAVAGCDGIVVAHMASVQERSYQTPEVPFDSNVKGTANLFFAAAEAGIRRAVLVSSTSSIGYWAIQKGRFITRDLPLKPWARTDIYGITKACQEVIAESYHREHAMHVGVLRVGYIIASDDAGKVADKYGKPVKIRHPANTERRDIGLAARLALEAPELGYEVFYVMSSPEAEKLYDVAYTRTRLGWKAQHDFMWLPPEEELPK